MAMTDFNIDLEGVNKWSIAYNIEVWKKFLGSMDSQAGLAAKPVGALKLPDISAVPTDMSLLLKAIPSRKDMLIDVTTLPIR
ncbi:hypothetical protein ACEPAG_4644 [Sanghuangporus baumii]